MPSQPSSFLADKLARQFRLLERTRANIDTLVAGGLLTDDAADRMYEALFLSAHVAIEGFIEEPQYCLLVGLWHITCCSSRVLSEVASQWFTQ